jgi:hypothetical protein
VAERPGDIVRPSSSVYHDDGSFVHEGYGKGAFGTWTRERVIFQATSPDPQVAISKGFTLSSGNERRRDVLMKGTRASAWKPVDAPRGRRP